MNKVNGLCFNIFIINIVITLCVFCHTGKTQLRKKSIYIETLLTLLHEISTSDGIGLSNSYYIWSVNFTCRSFVSVLHIPMEV